MFRILWKISVVLNNYWIVIYSYFLSFFFKKVGKNIKINSKGNQFTEPWNITIGHNFSTMGYLKIFADNAIVNIGDNCKINSNFTLGASGGHISIGNDVMIGPNVVLRSSDHCYKNKKIPMNLQSLNSGKIIIEDDVWIGANVTILKNVVVKRGSIIGAGSVITYDTEENSIFAGTSATKINTR